MNIRYDKIYIINLNKNFSKKESCILQMNNHNITNYVIVDAIDTINNLSYSFLYENIIKRMTPNFIKYNFSKGALGCLLSHINCIIDAKKNNYEQIIILEDDFMIIKDYKYELEKLNNNVIENWDFVYLGKKQGSLNCTFDIQPEIHSDKKFFFEKEINDFIYIPSYKTWATHSILVKNTVFDDIINFKKNIIGPIDLMLMTLYPKYKFYSVKNDLFITTDECSDIQIENKIKTEWNWNISLYEKINKHFIKNIYILGFKKSYHTHHYIHSMYYNFFKYYYPQLNIYWYDESEISKDYIFSNDSIIFFSPCHEKYKKIPKNTFYIIHLDEFDNRGYKTIDSFLDDEHNFKIINNNKYIIITCRENIKNLKYFEKNIDEKIICLPWFSNNFYDEIIKIKNSLPYIYMEKYNNKYLCFMGSIWSVNINIIKNLIDICEKNKVKLILKGRVFELNNDDENFIKNIKSTHLYVIFEPFLYTYDEQKEENTFDFIDNKYGIKGLLPIQGSEHDSNYISNRIFETISKGFLVVTNNSLAKKYFTSAIYNSDISKLIFEYIKILDNKELWINLMNDQINEFITSFYGYKNINSLMNFLKDTNKLNNRLLFYENNNEQKKYKLWFVNDCNYENKFYLNIQNNNNIRNAIINTDNYIINFNVFYDIYLIEQIISLQNYDIYLDLTYKNADCIINICNKFKKKCNLKKPLQIFCLISGQQTGSTLVIDYIQKYSKKTLALSEIFCNYENDLTYLNSYDIANEKGILYKEDIIEIKNNNVSEYFKQFEDIANYREYSSIIFKLTFDFFKDAKEIKLLDEILQFISKFNIIYLDRNDIDSYVSKKLVDKSNHSNIIYSSKILDNSFNKKELYLFIENKNCYIKKLNSIKYTYINYKDVVTDGKIFENINNIFNIFYNVHDLLDENLILNKCNYNVKQNQFDVNYILSNKFWD
jgi:GR25 family glycosyltransferase involved in LPS biosynthesis